MCTLKDAITRSPREIGGGKAVKLEQFGYYTTVEQTYQNESREVDKVNNYLEL